MKEPLQIINSKDTKARILLIGAVILALIFGWFGVRWQIGNMLSELTKPSDLYARDTMRVAIELAPSDPAAFWLAASTEKDIMTPEKIDSSVRLFEQSVRLSPYDYRWWIELGRAYEQADRPAQAEKALFQAVELAPSYAYPRWQLGNFLLRQGRDDEAFDQLKKTTENNLTYRAQVFSLAWDYFDKNPAKVEEIAADTPDTRASLALFYAAREQAADSLRIWNTLTPEQKTENPQTARIIAKALYEKKFYPQALEFARQTGIDPEAQAETVTNGGFEKFITDADSTNFGWKIARGENKLDITADSSVKRTGTKSLRISFKGYAKPELFNAWQIIAVEPSKNYRLSFWLKTENLRSAGEPLLQILNSNDNLLIAMSKPFLTGSNDWQEVTVDFRTPENCNGILLRTSRAYCGEACPITGTIWYDDFSLSSR